jgi:SRSO17 transposase
LVVEHLGDPEAVLVVDETGNLKKGTATVGVQRQYTALLGGSRTPRSPSYLVYASRAGHAVIDRELYLPQGWMDDPARLRAAGVPEQVGFATKPELAKAMVCRALDAGVPAAWVTGDEVYGANPGLRAELQARGVGYVLAVACDPSGRLRRRHPPCRRPAPTGPSAGVAAGVVRQGRQRPPPVRLGVHPPGPPPQPRRPCTC